jgi:hypothetical protein
MTQRVIGIGRMEFYCHFIRRALSQGYNEI